MPQKSHKQKANLLRKFGYGVKYGKEGNLTAAQKGAVTRTWNKIGVYLDNEKQDFHWQPVRHGDKRIISEGLGKDVITPKGFFVRVPKGVPKAPKYKIRPKDKAVIFEATGAKGGKIREEIHRVDPLLISDPPQLKKHLMGLVKSGPQPTAVTLTVNGFDTSKTTEHSVEALINYMAYVLIPRLKDPNTQTDEEGMEDEEIDNIFHLKLSFITPVPKSRK